MFCSLTGLFPDVGGGHALPRLESCLGAFLALTGHSHCILYHVLTLNDQTLQIETLWYGN